LLPLIVFLSLMGEREMTINRHELAYWPLALILLAFAFHAISAFPAHGETKPVHLAFLGLRFLNDHQKWQPTTDAERKRIAATEKQFTTLLAKSGDYDIIPLTDNVRREMAQGAPLGECGGCEAAYGKELHADRVAWMTVQKVSELILNMNVYVADPGTGKLTFVKSVDMRGNTDESWSRSLKYLLDNYFLKKPSQTSG
jgi:hypothetical protein